MSFVTKKIMISMNLVETLMLIFDLIMVIVSFFAHHYNWKHNKLSF